MSEADPNADTPDRSKTAAPPRRVIIRLSGEISTKARMTRRFFTKRLADNLRDAFKSHAVDARIVRTHDRMIVKLPRGASAEEASEAAQIAARVFGVQSAAAVEEATWRSSDDVVARALDFFAPSVVGKRFAVRARRVGDRMHIALDARELERRIGAGLAPESAGVDLSAPELTARIEVTADSAFFFHESLAGPAGLPLGVEGRAVALVSGGFDSAVAAWLLMKRGVALDYVFCNLGGESHQLGTLRVMKHIADHWSYGTRPRFHAIEFDPLSRAIQKHCTPRMWQIVLKRLFLAIAEDVAHERGALAIVTGDSLGQVSSQTLTNLATISEATSLPILRPLVGSNKEEIIGLSRLIGTHDLSKGVEEYCAIVPSKPATAASAAQAREEDARLAPEGAALREAALEQRSVLDLRMLDVSTREDPALHAERIELGDTIIDLRSKAAYQGWHYPEALYLDFPDALRAYPSFDPAQRYVLYCEIGLKSAHLAELMRRAGFDAVHFEGGLKQLRDYAREQGIDAP